MTYYLLTISICVALLAPIPSRADTKDSIVKIFTTAVTYNYDSPWQTSGSAEWTGSGSIISEHRILTNAHVVSNATFIEVKKNGDPRRFVAKVLAVSHDSDLALLQVEKESFFKDTKPLAFGTLPKLLDEVVVYGYPEGGNGLSVTRGVTSRIEITQYAHSRLMLLGVQIDAAINSGNSGGPVILDHKIVGVATQTKVDAENIGYIVPVPIIEHFLTDLKDGQYDGFPDDGITTQPLENQTLRDSLRLPDTETGVYVFEVVPGGSTDGPLRPGDVLLSIDNKNIANDGSVVLRPGLRVQYDYYFSARQLGEKAEVTLWRDGQKISLSIPLIHKRGESYPIKPPQYDSPPEYIILAGVILTPLTYDYLTTWGAEVEKKAPPRLSRYLYKKRAVAEEQVVIINGLLSSEMSAGYQGIATDERVISVNGQSFANFKMMVEMIDEALKSDDPITLQLEDKSIVVLSAVDHKMKNKNLLSLYGVGKVKRVNK